MENRGVYRYFVFLFVILTVMGVIVFLPVLQGFFSSSGFWNGITGAATSSTTTLSVSINNAPQVNFVAAVGPQTISAGSTALFAFKFNVTDADGWQTINNNSATVRINYTGAPDNYNTSNNVTCSPFLQTSSTSITYNCNVTVWYFAQAANWTINASINDTAGVYAENSTSTFQIQSTTSMDMTPTALTWPSLELGTTNRTSNVDPIRINNSGNDDIDVGGVSITAYDLYGLTTTSDFIGVGNFSIHAVNGSPSCAGDGCKECNGTSMINKTAAPVTTANISAGNYSRNDGTGQEDLFFCIRQVPTIISRQTYDTSAAYTDPWIIAVS